MDHKSQRRGVRTTENTFAIIDALRELEKARNEELAEHLNLSTSTVNRHLHTLYKERYVTKEGDMYRLSHRFLTFGGYIRSQFPHREKIEDAVVHLSEESGERAQFVIEEHGQRVFLFTHAHDRAIRAKSVIGKRGPLHCSAAGKAILSKLSETQVDKIIDRWGLPEKTNQTITDRDTLFKELTMISEQNIAYNKEESTPELRAIGTTISDSNERLLGAISVSGPSHRMEGKRFSEELPTMIQQIAQELELKIKYEE